MSRAAWGTVAHNLRVLADSIDAAIEPDAARASVAPAVPSGAPAAGVGAAPASAPAPNTGECPKHHVAWEPGTYGPYCKQMTDDPAWGKPKTDRDGNPVLWCRITPKNAPDWLRVNAA